MRVAIDHSEFKTGMIRKVTHYGVKVKVEFSEEEKAIIKKRKLGDTIVMERGSPTLAPNLEDYHLTIEMLLNKDGDNFTFSTPIAAKQYDEHLKGALRQLKAFLEGNAETASSTTFEL